MSGADASPVVVGYDGRPQGRDALALGAGLARALDAPLVVAAVYSVATTAVPLPVDVLRADADQLAKEGVAEIAAELDARPYTVGGLSTAHGLHDLAEAEDAAVLVVGSSHRGALGRVLAGNVATQLLTGSACPVAVAPRGIAGDGGVPLRTIGVGFDGSPESWSALQRAAALAVASGGRMRIIHALEPLFLPHVTPDASEKILKERRKQAEMAAEQAIASVSRDAHPESRLVLGYPAPVLEAQAHDDLDLLALGSRGFGPLRRVLLGSVSSQLVRLAPCPVLVVPRSVNFDASEGGLAARDELAPAEG